MTENQLSARTGQDEIWNRDFGNPAFDVEIVSGLSLVGRGRVFPIKLHRFYVFAGGGCCVCGGGVLLCDLGLGSLWWVRGGGFVSPEYELSPTKSRTYPKKG